MGDPSQASEEPSALSEPCMQRLQTAPVASGLEEEMASVLLPLKHSFSSVEQTAQQQETGESMGPRRSKRRLISRAELLRHSSCSLLRMLSSSILLGGPKGAPNGQPEMQEGVMILYITGWHEPHVHHRVAGGPWSVAPGPPMSKVDSQTAQGKELMRLLPQWLRGPAENKLWHFFSATPNLELLPNDGYGNWDKAPRGQHYYAGTAGCYILYRGNLQRLPEPPESPAVLRCTEAGSSHACLCWNPNPFKTENIAGYNIYRDGVLVATVDGSSREYTDRSLLGLRVYSYCVSAVNPEGQEGPLSDVVYAKTAEPGKPSAPRNVVCCHRAPDRIEISWEPPANHGGAPVRFYRVYKDDMPVAFLPAVGPQEHKFTDVNVKQGVPYSYSVSAWHDIPPPESNGSSSSSTSSKNDSSSGLFRVYCPGAVEGLRSDPVKAKAEVLLQGPRLDDGKGHIMLQGFNWVSCQNRHGWYNVLCHKLQDIKKLGVSILWCPPPTECVGWEGYMPTKWYSLHSRYGSPADLQRMIRSYAEEGIACCVDLVANHRCGTRQDSRGHWTVFEAPDWGPWAVVRNNLQGYHGEGGEDTGVSVDCAPDIDHTNPQVQKDMKDWTKWLMQDIGYLAFRIDMAGGYAPQYQQAFVENLGRPFTVGEYWDGDTRALVNYVRAAAGSLAAFDFAFYYHLQRAVETGNFGILNCCGNLNGLVGIEPRLAVTFVENHDTDHLDYCHTFCNGELNGVLQGYAVILTHPGVPCIYWNHYSDYGPYCRQKLQELADVRTSKGIHSTSGIYMTRTEWGLYAAYIAPKDRWCNPHNASVAMKIGPLDWQPEGGKWQIATCGHNFCVWTR